MFQIYNGYLALGKGFSWTWIALAMTDAFPQAKIPTPPSPPSKHIHSILKLFCHFCSIEFVNCQITESCHPFPPQKSVPSSVSEAKQK